MFNKFFRPKWQHRKAAVRIAALNELEADDPVLSELAGNDKDPAVRREALRRICDLPCLVRLVAEESDEAVRESGKKRLKRLLAGAEETHPELVERLQVLQSLGDEDVLAYVLKHAVEPELRQAALETVNRPSLLAEAALSDPSNELRLAALEKIDRDATLERIVREAKGKDKRVARRAREKLEAMRTEAVRPERQAAICEAIELLVEQGGVDLIRLGHLQKEWDSLLPAATAELEQRYASACTAFSEAQVRLQAEAARAAHQRELVERGEALQQDAQADSPDLSAIQNSLTRLQHEWQSLKGELPSLNPSLSERFNMALSRTEQLLGERQARDESQKRLQEIIDTLVALTKEGGRLDATALKRLEAQWRDVVGKSRQGDFAELQTRFTQMLKQARHRLSEQGLEREQLQKRVSELLSSLETALTDGQLQHAASAYDKIRNRAEKLRELGGTMSASQQKRQQSAVSRLNELRDWRRFGTTRAREELLEQMVALAQASLPPLKLAEAVKGLRNEWRQLDRKDGPAGEALWHAFDEAAETAYSPCRAFYEAQQKDRSTHLEQRQKFITELEHVYEGVDWQSPDWADLDSRLQQARKQWQKLGGVERRDWQAINDQFKQLLDRFEAHLGPQREREKHRREGLIASLERMAEEPDLEKALASTKAAQAAWRPLISCSPRIEQGLWRRFKAACDAVYARQREKAKAQRQAEQGEQARLQRICDEISHLSKSLNAENLGASIARLSELKAQWLEADSQVLRHNKGMEKRFDMAVSDFMRAIAALEQQQAEAERRLLLEKLAVCEAMEGLLFEESGSDSAALLATWQDLPALRDALFAEALEHRFEQARLALSDAGDRLARITGAAADNLAQRQALCLQLELLAGIESPPAYAEERMQLQVAMLSDAMTGQLTGEERRENAHRLLGQYLAIGPVLPQERGVLAMRLQAILFSRAIQ